MSDSVEGDGADSMHHIVTADVTAARVSRAHWNGKQFGAFAPGAAPTLSFLGSQEFAYVTPARRASHSQRRPAARPSANVRLRGLLHGLSSSGGGGSTFPG